MNSVPLFPSDPPARAMACSIVSQVRHPERDRDRIGRREVDDAARYCIRKHVEMRCLAANEAAERNDRVIATGIGEKRRRGWKLERTRYLEQIDGRAGFGRSQDRAALQRERDLPVPSRAYDGDPRAIRRGFGGRACLNLLHRTHFRRARSTLARFAF